MEEDEEQPDVRRLSHAKHRSFLARNSAPVPPLRLGGAMRSSYRTVLSFTDPIYTQADGFVFRLHTSAGISPTTGCASTTDVGKRYRSPYSTQYYFVDVYWYGF